MNHTTINGDGPIVNLFLVMAGVIGPMITAPSVSTVYFLLLIPPAAWHLYVWTRKVVFPWFRKPK